MSTYAITGATGFIGKQLVRTTLQDGHKVILISRKPTPGLDAIICNFELKDFSSINLSNIDTVFHLAGFTHDMRDTSKISDLYYKVNVDATVQLANLAVKSGVKKFIFVSSVKAGGAPGFGVCASENDQGEPEGIYGKTKREAELKLLKIGKKSGMHVSIIRSSLVYGPDVKGNLKLMLSGIKKAWFPPLPETGNKRSMIHVVDLVRAILLVADDNRANGKIFIATDGILYSSREIYNTMCNVLGKSIPKWSVPKFLFDMISFISPRIKYKVDKLLGGECYSSKELEKLGFKAQKTLRDMNEANL